MPWRAGCAGPYSGGRRFTCGNEFVRYRRKKSMLVMFFFLFPFISLTASNLKKINLVLREHAIFTLRNLLENNLENQEFVHSLKPSQEWDDDGTLNTIAGAVLK